MTAKEYIKVAKTQYKSAEDWAKIELYTYIQFIWLEYKKDEIDIEYMKALTDCKDWEDAEAIANNWII